MAMPTTTHQFGADQEPAPPGEVGLGLVRGQRQRRQHRGEGEAVVETTLGGQRMADSFGDALVIEQCIDQRDLGGSDYRRQTHRLPQRHDGKNQQCRRGAEEKGQENPDDEQPERDIAAPDRRPEVELGSLVEQDDRQRQLRDDGEARGVGAAFDHVERERPNTIPNRAKISAGAVYHFLTSPETTA
jgi:hypothetical protein